LVAAAVRATTTGLKESPLEMVLARLFVREAGGWHRWDGGAPASAAFSHLMELLDCRIECPFMATSVPAEAVQAIRRDGSCETQVIPGRILGSDQDELRDAPGARAWSPAGNRAATIARRLRRVPAVAPPAAARWPSSRAGGHCDVRSPSPQASLGPPFPERLAPVSSEETPMGLHQPAVDALLPPAVRTRSPPLVNCEPR